MINIYICITIIIKLIHISVHIYYFSQTEACRNDIKKIIRLLVTIQQLLLDLNPNLLQENNTLNLNLPVGTPEALEEFNTLIMQDSVALLQYVSYIILFIN